MRRLHRPVLRRSALALALFFGAAGSADADADAGAGAEARRATAADRSVEGPTRTVSIPGGERLDLRLEGTLVDLALARGANGLTSIVLLVRSPAVTDAVEAPSKPPVPDLCAVEESERPLQLLRLSMDRDAPAGRLESIAEGLPGDIVQLAAVDTDGDGTDELLLGRPGELLSMPADRGASPRSLLGPNQLGVMVPRVHGGDFIVDRTTRTLAIATSGALRFFRFNRFNSVAATGELEQVAEVPMPPASSVAGSGANMRLVLQQAGPRFVGHDAAGGALFTSAPVLAGGQRIGATLIVPGASADVPGQIEWWARLPSPERLIESFLRTLDGEPVVVVTSMPADRFSLFGEKRLRVLPLRGDRTRSGHPPLLAVETGANLWQDAQLFVYDVDGDGRSDLLFGYWKGLKDTTIALEAYLRREDGSFAPRPIKMQFDIEGGDRKQIGVVPAPGRTTGSVLLALSEAGLVTLPLRTLERGRGKLVDVGGARVFPLAAGVTSGGRLGIPAGSQPDRLVLPHERASTLPQVVDLDGDGAREIVVRAPATAAWPVSVLKLH